MENKKQETLGHGFSLAAVFISAFSVFIREFPHPTRYVGMLSSQGFELSGW